jgi:hypothetical protein
MDNTDFSMKVNNENYEEWYGSEDMHECSLMQCYADLIGG